MNLIALWLATWRLTSLILYEGGPLDVFRKLRHLVKADREGELSNFSVLFTCPWCLSVWVGAFLITSVLIVPRTIVLSYVLSASAVAVLIDARVRYEP